jgi:hypothetical protein
MNALLAGGRREVSVRAGAEFQCLYFRSPRATVPRMHKIMFVLACLLMTPLTLFAGIDVSGKWNAKVDLGTQGGSPTFVLKQDGEKLTGTYSGQLGSSDLTGTVKDSTVKFDFEVMGIKVHYEGKVSDDGSTIEGTCDYGGQATGTFKATRAKE